MFAITGTQLAKASGSCRRGTVGASAQLSRLDDLSPVTTDELVVLLALGQGIDLLYHVETRDTLAKDDIVPVEVVCGRDSDGEVCAVGVRAAISDTQQVRAIVLQLQAAGIVVELAAVDALSSIHAGLVNESVNDSVEVGALEDVRLTLLT